jgi:hypothetical protein
MSAISFPRNSDNAYTSRLYTTIAPFFILALTMSQEPNKLSDVQSIVLSLDSAKLSQRMAELHAEEEAVLVLLRAAKARERAQELSRLAGTSKGKAGASHE